MSAALTKSDVVKAAKKVPLTYVVDNTIWNANIVRIETKSSGQKGQHEMAGSGIAGIESILTRFLFIAVVLFMSGSPSLSTMSSLSTFMAVRRDHATIKAKERYNTV